MIPPLPAALHRAIRQLCQDHPEWGTRDGAFGRCTEACTALLRILGALDEPSDFVPITVPRLHHPHPHWERFRGHEHCIAHYGIRLHRHRLMIDLTARQFDAEAPFPHITPF